ncbi:MAG: ATP synthase F1 subunit delta [Lachnospiraceae bacterium]|nr:ATP synthase F1 subunit delta [Lachnospiraceae bacterium]
MAKLIAKTYGSALFELAVEQGKTNELMREFTAISDVLKFHPDYNSLLNHPKILKEAKIEMLENVFKERVSNEMTGFLELLIIKDRFNDIKAIYEQFMMMVKDYLSIGVAFVTTAFPMNEIQKSEIVERLLAVTEFKEMEMNYAVDEKIIGGMIIRIGDRIVDSSIATNLANLRKQLISIQI